MSGAVNIAGGNIATHQSTNGLNAAEIKQLFNPLYTVIESNKKVSPAKKEDLKAEVKEIQSTVIEAAQKNEKVDESFLSRPYPVKTSSKVIYSRKLAHVSCLQ